MGTLALKILKRAHFMHIIERDYKSYACRLLPQQYIDGLARGLHLNGLVFKVFQK